MKISPAKINSFILNIPSDIRAILLYGPDLGLIDERCIDIKNIFLGKTYEDTQLIEIFARQIKEKPNYLAEQAYNISLFGDEKKCIILREINDSSTKIIKEYLDKPDPLTLLIIKSPELSPSSSLRKLFEQIPNNVVAIPCYTDTASSLKQIILDKLNSETLRIEDNTLNLLISILGNDRGVTNSEIEKLILFCKDKGKVQIEDIEEIISESELIGTDKFIYSLFNFEEKAAYKLSSKLIEEMSGVGLIRLISTHAQKLLQAKGFFSEFNNIDEAIKMIKPPIFFSNIEKFKKQVATWPERKLQKIVEISLQLEVSIKTNPNIETLLIKDLIIKRFTKS